MQVCTAQGNKLLKTGFQRCFFGVAERDQVPPGNKRCARINHMRIFMPAIEAGLSHKEITAWLNRPDHDPKTWTLKPGAPKVIVDIFPKYVEFFLTPDNESSKD